MRFAHAALAFVVSTGTVMALTADARAQSCNNYNPTYEGNVQYQLGNNNCKPLTGVHVAVVVTQDIVVASETQGYDGFSMQLNVNGPNSVKQNPNSTQNYWTQFVIEAYSGSGIVAHSQQFSNAGPSPNHLAPNDLTLGIPAQNGPFFTIPAGTTFGWDLAIDANTGNIESCEFSATDNAGTNYIDQTETIPTGDRVPIYSLNMDIVGNTNDANTTFQSGKGIIYYAADNFSASYDFPSCAFTWPGVSTGTGASTGEQSDAVYGPLVAAGSGGWSFTQEFFTSTVGVFRDETCGYPGNGYPSSLGDWAVGDYKGVCPLGQPMYGVSRVPGQTWSHAVECGMSGQAAYSNSGTGCYARAAENQSNRGDTDNGWDWDPDSYKTECRADEYVAGVSQASGNGVVTSILCCPASVTHQSCDAQVFYDGPSAANAAPDWDVGYYKGQCPTGQYVAGISTPAYASVGIFGAAHAILCCSQ